MKKFSVFISLLLCFASSMYADDAFSVDNVTLPKNGEADVVVKFSLDAGSTCSGYTFWLQVPEQLAFVTYVKNEKTYVTYTAGDCYDETPTITPNIDEGYLKVGCLTANSDPIIGQTGTLVTFRLKVIGNVNVGDVLKGKLINGTISAENGTVHSVSDANFNITIGNPTDTRTILDENSTNVPPAASNVDVRVKRNINTGSWSSICLPFDMTEAQTKEAFGNDVQLAEFKGVNSEFDANDNVVGIKVNFNSVNSITANTPYIIKVSNAVSEFTLDGVNITPDEDEAYIEFDNGKTGSRRVVYSGFYGTYHADTPLDKNTLFLSGGKFWYSAGLTKMKAFRAFFSFLDILTEVEDAGVKMVVNIDDEETGIENVNVNDNSMIYDLSGRHVYKAQKGVYIVNGKKVLK